MTGNTRARILFYGFNIALPLFCGLYLYLTLRADAYISLFIRQFIPLPDFPFASLPEWTIAFLRNFASDMLWAYSLGFSIMLIMGYSQRKKLFALCLCVGFEVLMEVFQKIGVFHGTFDFWDILLEAISICLALFFIKMFEEAQNEKSSKST